MAVFFGEEWEIIRYLFFMDDENKVCRNRQTFDARNPFQLTHYLRESYNYSFSIKNILTSDGLGPNMKISPLLLVEILKRVSLRWTA
ncbi:hypothetical protein ACEPAF_2202 [Sanghuangporus sanghuang]